MIGKTVENLARRERQIRTQGIQSIIIVDVVIVVNLTVGGEGVRARDGVVLHVDVLIAETGRRCARCIAGRRGRKSSSLLA
jgi:hypothetical protein